MRTTNTVLGLIHERGRKGLPLERVQRLLYTPDLYLRAYGKLYRNKGAMTKGATDEEMARRRKASPVLGRQRGQATLQRGDRRDGIVAVAPANGVVDAPDLAPD